jgi:hypothetical protein
MPGSRSRRTYRGEGENSVRAKHLHLLGDQQWQMAGRSVRDQKAVTNIATLSYPAAGRAIRQLDWLPWR